MSDALVAYIVIHCALATPIGIIAGRYNQNAIRWACIALVLSPWIAAIFLFLITKADRHKNRSD